MCLSSYGFETVAAGAELMKPKMLYYLVLTFQLLVLSIEKCSVEPSKVRYYIPGGFIWGVGFCWLDGLVFFVEENIKIKGEEGSSMVKESGEVHAPTDGIGGGKFVAKNEDAGAVFVLESKGNWKHAGFHLTTAIVAPPLLSLPFTFTALGWAPGILILILGGAVSFYAYNLMSQVLEQAELEGHRLLRFRDMGGYVLGRKWGLYAVAPIQFIVCFGSVIAFIILAGQSMKFLYIIYNPNGTIQLYEFIIFFGIVMLVLSQLPSFHSLRYINLLSLLCCLGYSLCAVGASIYIGHSSQAPAKDYGVTGNSVTKLFGIFNSMAIIATTYGSSIIPEIQATLAPPTTGKMFKGLLICYAVVFSTFFSVSISGYWAFGNLANGNLFLNFAPSGGPALIPNWLIMLPNILILTQLVAGTLVYLQPSFEIFEGRSSNVNKGMLSLRNLIPRFLLRSSYVGLATLIAAALPFFSDILALFGAFGFTPLDFVLPFVFYNITFKPSPRTFKFWLHYLIIIVFSIVGLLGCISSLRQIILDAKNYKLFANL